MNQIKNIIISIVLLVATYFLCSALITHIGNSKNYDMPSLNQYTTATVIRSDGSYEDYDTCNFPVLNTGDLVIATVHLPEELYNPDSSLCFNVYNCVITVQYGTEVLYTYGSELKEKGRLIGHVYARVPIPDEAFGNDIYIVCYATERSATSTVKNITILPTSESYKYFINGKLFIFIVFIAIYIISLLATVYMAITPFLRNTAAAQGITLAVLCHMLSVYIMCYSGVFNILFSNVRIPAMCEYVSLFILPVCFLAYFFRVRYYKSDALHFKIMLIIFSIFFVLTTLLNYTTRNFHYSYFVSTLHVMLIISLGIIVYSFFKGIREVSATEKISLYGMTAFVVIFALDIIRFNIDKFTSINLNGSQLTFLQLGLFIFIASLFASFLSTMFNVMRESEELSFLRKAAYLDALTGLLNRAKCQEFIDHMKADNTKSYALVFLDINNLKEANDNYGHNTGDNYIRSVAIAINHSFQSADICSRIGGDEFMIIFENKSLYTVNSCIRAFDKNIASMNAMKEMPFFISVARGVIISSEISPIPIDEAIEKADKQMYTNKKELKEKYNLPVRGIFSQEKGCEL